MGGLKQEGQGLVHGHTAHGGQVCTMTLDALASWELHLVFKGCKPPSVHMHVHGSIIHNSSRVESTQVSITWVEKHVVLYPYNRILFIHTKERNTDT